MASGNEPRGAILLSGGLSSDEPTDSHLSVVIVWVYVDLCLVRLVAPTISMQWLIPRPWSDREANGVVQLRTRGRVYLLVAAPVPILLGQDFVADGLVDRVVDDVFGADGTLANHAFDPPGLDGEEIALPDDIGFDMGAEFPFDLSEYIFVHGTLDFAAATQFQRLDHSGGISVRLEGHDRRQRICLDREILTFRFHGLGDSGGSHDPGDAR